MSRHKDEQWLDEQLRRAVDGAPPVFDAPGWKQRHAAAYEALLARGRPRRFGVSGRSWWTRVAVAAGILLVGGVILVGRRPPTLEEPLPRPHPAVWQSPAQMVSMLSLSAAFRAGGMEGLDRQCDRALERLGPRPNRVSTQELLKDLNNKG